MNIESLPDGNLAAYAKYIKLVIPSKEMSRYLSTGDHPSAADIVDIVFYSPVISLHEKRDAIDGVYAETPLEHQDLRNKCKNTVLYLNQAIELLESEGIFTLELWHFDEETKSQESYCFEGSYSTFADALVEIESWQSSDPYHWSELTLWNKDPNGKLQEAASYIIAGSRSVYCDLENCILQQIEDFDMESAWQFDMLRMTDLNVPVPFKPGNIVEVGSAPFIPKQKILITEIGDNYDCCCVQGMGLTANGKYETGALKHGYVGYGRNYILPSLLYEMTTYFGPIEDVRFLKEISDLIVSSTADR